MVSDVLVVGAGPAGLSAATYACRHGYETMVLEAGSVGGELVNRHRLDDLPGLPEARGPELRGTLVEQFRDAGGSITLATVDGIDLDRPIEVSTAEGTYETESIIVATGSEPVRLDVPGEETYRDRGVFYCAMCDGPLYTDEVVAVAGSSDWALTDALFLTEHAARVLVVEPDATLAAGSDRSGAVRDHPDIEVVTGTEIRELDGGNVLETVTLAETGTDGTWVESIQGLYVQQGATPSAPFLPSEVPRTDSGAVVVDRYMETEVPGLFAVGDVRASSPYTVAAAIDDGGTAARAATRDR